MKLKKDAGDALKCQDAVEPMNILLGSVAIVRIPYL
jgi:hypothetical protein